MKIMKIRVLSTFLFLSVLSVSSHGADITLVPSIGYGMSNLKFTRSVGGEDASAEIPLGEEYTYGPALIRQVKREDYGYSVGYYVLETLSVFGGYSYGKTSIISFDGGGGLPPYPVYTQHLDEGIYIGANYSIYVGKTGTIGLNLAYADMDGKYIVQDSDPGGVSSSETGKTSGYSFGITWSDTIKNKTTYYVSYKQKSYKTDLVTISIDKAFNIFTFGFVFPI
jgi:hypothetical protein